MEKCALPEERPLWWQGNYKNKAHEKNFVYQSSQFHTSGSLLENGTFEFWEELNGEKTARIELMYQNGQIMGVWEKVDGSNSFPIDWRIY